MKFFSFKCKLCGKKVKYLINHIWKHHKDSWNTPEIRKSPNGVLLEVENRFFEREVAL